MLGLFLSVKQLGQVTQAMVGHHRYKKICFFATFNQSMCLPCVLKVFKSPFVSKGPPEKNAINAATLDKCEAELHSRTTVTLVED